MADSRSAPFNITSDWGKWALGFGLLWFLLALMVEAGAGELAAAIAVLVAGGMTVVAADRVTQNLGIGR